MAKRIYVGNLPWAVDSAQLSEMFGEFGEVSSADVITERETGRSRGFGFVEMPNDGEAEAAIDEMNEKDLGGRPLVVNEARPKQPRPPRGGGGGGRY